MKIMLIEDNEAIIAPMSSPLTTSFSSSRAVKKIMGVWLFFLIFLQSAKPSPSGRQISQDIVQSYVTSGKAFQPGRNIGGNMGRIALPRRPLHNERLPQYTAAPFKSFS